MSKKQWPRQQQITFVILTLDIRLGPEKEHSARVKNEIRLSETEPANKAKEKSFKWPVAGQTWSLLIFISLHKEISRETFVWLASPEMIIGGGG